MLGGTLAATFRFVIFEALLAGYRTVLVRPPLRKRHRLTVAGLDTIVTDIARHAIGLAPVACGPAPDPGDQFLWDLLAARADLLRVTGDKRLLQNTGMQGRVVTPREFAAGLT